MTNEWLLILLVVGVKDRGHFYLCGPDEIWSVFNSIKSWADLRKGPNSLVWLLTSTAVLITYSWYKPWQVVPVGLSMKRGYNIGQVSPRNWLTKGGVERRHLPGSGWVLQGVGCFFFGRFCPVFKNRVPMLTRVCFGKSLKFLATSSPL